MFGVTVGKDWSIFVPLASSPTTLDFHGPAGIPFARQPQIRYANTVGGYKFEFAIEESANEA